MNASLASFWMASLARRGRLRDHQFTHVRRAAFDRYFGNAPPPGDVDAIRRLRERRERNKSVIDAVAR